MSMGAGVSVYERVNEEFACRHDDVELRRRVIASGVVQVWRQCTRCGRALGSIKKASLPPAQLASLAPFDEELPNRWHRQWRQRYQELHEKSRADNDAAWRASYESYMDSPDWQEKRRLVLRRDDRVCQGCGAARATDVHHLTYAHLGHEFLWELVAICRCCHERLHGYAIGEME